MFSLIISIVAITLVVVLTLATFYYGGDVLTDGKKQAGAAGLISQSQQISGAVEMYYADNPSGAVSTIAELHPQYLKSVPDGWDVSASVLSTVPGYVAYPIAGDDTSKLRICEEVNKKLGITGPVPQCSAIPENFAGCCTSS